MIKFIIATLIVLAVVLGGLLAFRRNRGGEPSQEIIDRVKVRERELEAQERADGED